MVQFPLHVLHIIPSLDRSGAETALSRLVVHSDPGALRHTVLSLTDKGPLSETIEGMGGTVIALGLRGWGSFPGVVGRLFECVRQAQPDVIQGWMTHANLLSWIARAWAAPSSQLAWNLRGLALGTMYESPLTSLLKRAAALCSRQVDLLISNSIVGLEHHRQLGYRARRTAVVPNGFDVNEFAPDPLARQSMRQALGFGDDEVVFGVFARFHPAKGHEPFLAAAAKVLGRSPQARFLIVGAQTRGNPKFESLLRNFGVEGAACVLGERSDVPALMRAADVVCLPSYHEGFPNVVGEAMSSGVPCVATDVSDVKSILGDGGLIVPPGDPDALAQAMIAIAQLPPETRVSMGEAGRRRVVGNYSLSATVERYRTLYAELSSERRERGRRNFPASRHPE